MASFFTASPVAILGIPWQLVHGADSGCSRNRVFGLYQNDSHKTGASCAVETAQVHVFTHHVSVGAGRPLHTPGHWPPIKLRPRLAAAGDAASICSTRAAYTRVALSSCGVRPAHTSSTRPCPGPHTRFMNSPCLRISDSATSSTRSTPACSRRHAQAWQVQPHSPTRGIPRHRHRALDLATDRGSVTQYSFPRSEARP